MDIEKKVMTFLSRIKPLVLLLTIGFVLAAAAGTTLAVIVTRTPTLNNLFISGLDPVGDLAIHKIVEHPFGDSYVVPDNENTSFTFQVDLGKENANKSFGSDTANENGIVTVDVKAGDTVSLTDIPYGTEVTVTEQSCDAGFSAQNGESVKKVNIRRGVVNSVSFTNIYTPAPAPADISVTGTKTLEGRDWQEGDSFTFRLERYEDGVWNSLGDKTITCRYIEQEDPDNPGQSISMPDPDSIAFDFSDLVDEVSFQVSGIYSFRVTEVGGSIGGITYDKTESYFDVLVGDADMDGALEIQKILSSSENTQINGNNVTVNFKNSYAPAGSAEAVIKIKKTLDDTSGQNRVPEGFEFVLYNENNEQAAVSEATSASGESELRLVFTPADVGRTFAYTLKEVHSGETIDGIKYDDKEIRFYVSVVDNLDGTVSAFVYDDQGLISVFEEPEESGEEEAVEEPEEPDEEEAVEEPEKSDEEKEMEEPEDQIIPSDSENPELDEEKVTEFSEEDISEEEPEMLLSVAADEKRPNIPSDVTNIYNVSFENIYDPEGISVSFGGVKELTGREMKEGEFRFVLYQTGADFIISEDAQPLKTVFNAADGSFTFGTLDFEEVGTYYYAVVEDDSEPLGGVTYDNGKYIITVQVSDDGGKLSADSSVKEESGKSSEIVFRNSYKAVGTTVSLSGNKKLVGSDLKAGEFVFDLYQTDKDFSLNGKAIQSVKNDGAGNFVFGDLIFTDEGVWYYLVKENGTIGVPGIVYDEAEYHVTVTVNDDGAGKLVSSVIMTRQDGQEQIAADKLQFTNRYSEKDTMLSLGGKKILHGAALKEGMFAFRLFEADDTFSAKGEAVRNAVNAADGSFTFDALTYEKAGIYRYIMIEDASKALDHISYDNTVYGITVTVKDDGGGRLTAESVIKELGGKQVEQAVFENTYTAAEGDASVDITVKKTVKNTGSESIGPEGFRFVLENKDTKERSVLQSDEAGFAVFRLVFTENEKGHTSRYELYEENGKQEGVTYSDVIYKFEVAVAEDSDGKLAAEVHYNGEPVEQFTAEFVNRYQSDKDDTPDRSDTPDKSNVISTDQKMADGARTGDDSHLILWMVLLVLSVAALIGFVFVGKARKKKTKEKDR